MGKIRIIGGVHRSRQLQVLDANGLRPTLDRVKETLFNWLGQDLTGMDCLDLFAGSGSLGFEAVSRNAKSVILVEKDRTVSKNLSENKKILKANNCQIINDDALNFLQSSNLFFDVVFVDPPYASDLLARVLEIIDKRMKPGGFVYIEYDKDIDLSQFIVYKKAKAGVVNYALLQIKEN